MAEVSSNAAAQASKALRSKYGVHGKPTLAVKAYRKDMAFDHDGVNRNSDGSLTERIETHSWILITPDGRRCHLNTYNGEVGAKVNPDNFTYDALPPKEMAKKLKKYTEVPVSECPFATLPVATEESSKEEGSEEKTEDVIPSSEGDAPKAE
jgi:hypothetical protein